MRRLILLRHAKAEGDAPSGDDFDRALAPRGQREARAVAAKMAALGLHPDVALVSPALRTRQTFEAVDEALPGAQAHFDRSLYNADAGALRQLAQEAGEDAGTVLVVGHNPGVQELAVRLMAEGHAPAAYLARATIAFPPAAMAVFAMDETGRAVAEGLHLPERDA